MLAMDVNDDACFLNARGALTIIASMLAPTKKANNRRHHHRGGPLGPSAGHYSTPRSS